MTLQVTVTRADDSGRLRIGRLDLVLAPGEGGGTRNLWPQRWDHGVVVLRPEKAATPLPVPPVVVTGQGRLRLPPELCAHLDATRQPVLVACDGRDVWLANATYLAALLP